MSKALRKTNPRLGPTVRRLRRNRGLTQARVAETLGISAPYLNLIEHNKRSVTAELLLKIADLFGLELNDLMSGDDTQLFTDLMEALGDPVLAEQDVTNLDVRDLVSAHPVVARAMLSLYDALRKSRTDLATLAERLESVGDDFADVDASLLPADVVSDFIQSHNNYFPQLEDVASEVRAASSIDDDPYQGLIDYIETTFDGIRVVILPSATMNVQHGTVRKFDPVMRTLMISELLPCSSRKFQIAHQLGLIVANDQIEALLDEGGLARGDSRALGRVALSNYFAAALLMPYGPFLDAARDMRYDIEMLEHRFEVSFEQVCHRLTTLSRSGAKGVPFHLLRVDIAGNTSKRFSASGLSIPRHGGACPRWNVYAALMTPGRIHTQLGQLTDGSSHFCIARTVRYRGGRYGTSESFYSIGIGCEASHAHELVYADGLDLDNSDNIVPIGISCRICERMDCRQRAFPPIQHRLDIDENARGLSAYVTAK